MVLSILHPIGSGNRLAQSVRGLTIKALIRFIPAGQIKHILIAVMPQNLLCQIAALPHLAVHINRLPHILRQLGKAVAQLIQRQKNSALNMTPRKFFRRAHIV